MKNDNTIDAQEYTMLGKLPRDWNIIPLKEGITLYSGTHILADNCNEDGRGVPYLTGPSDFQDGTIRHTLYTEKPITLCQSGDILITVKGSGVGTIIIADNKYCISRQLMALRVSKWDNRYVYYTLLNSARQFSNAAAGLIPGLSRSDVLGLLIPTPPKLEQRSIVKILNTWDTAIDTMRKLIAEKEKRKKGLMQQLLTGKKRLPGFKGKWKNSFANELFKNISRKNNGVAELLSVTQDRGAIPRKMLEGRVTMPQGKTDSYKLVEPGDFIVSLRSFQGGIEFSEYRGIVSPAYTVLQAIEVIDRRYWKYFFKSSDFIGRLAVAVIGIRDGKQISYDDFSRLKFTYPTIEEQAAIAEVLSTADRELELLIKKLEAITEQKKGLMQKLLTGEVRLKG